MAKLSLSPRAASILARLDNLADERNVDRGFIRRRYANECFLRRLSSSPHRELFVLKGGTLFSVWSDIIYRTTHDIDLHVPEDYSPAAMTGIMHDVLNSTNENDGDDAVTFQVESLQIRKEPRLGTIGGFRIKFSALLGNKPVAMLVDIGIGDVITPEPILLELPVLLDFTNPTLPIYPRETAIAEKLEIILRLGMVNSRIKDYFDICILARSDSFSGEILVKAIHATCTHRGTMIPSEPPEGLYQFFEEPSKEAEWNGFYKKYQIQEIMSFSEVGEILRQFLLPPLDAARDQKPYLMDWVPTKGWRMTDGTT